MSDLKRCSHCNAVTRYEYRSRVSILGWLFFLAVAIGSAAAVLLLNSNLFAAGMVVALLGLGLRDRYYVCPKCSVKVAEVG